MNPTEYLLDAAGHDLDDDGSRRLDVSEDRSRSVKVGTTSPQFTEPSSFANGLLSPFSPLLKDKSQRNEYLNFVSLIPCRKLSVVVRVLPVADSEEQRCLFPHVKETDQLIQKPNSHRDVVVVKPSAFGKSVPTHVCMDTAKLLSRIAKIPTEDWARLYKFHHVIFEQDRVANASADSTDGLSLDAIARASVQDALGEHQSSCFISFGHASTCVEAPEKENFDTKCLKCLLARISEQLLLLLEEKAVATFSVLELLEEKDTFADVLDRKNKPTLKHVDMNGAILENLTEISLENFSDIWLHLRSKRREQTLVVTINIWFNAVSHQINRAPDSQITCVELARPMDSTSARAKHRSTLSLGLVLRQLLLHAPSGTDPAVSFRESTITKVLQRSLVSSKIVLLASVSPLSKDYEATLTTLNFLRQLLVKPGKMASSPFGEKDQQPSESLHSNGNNLNSEIVDPDDMLDQLQKYVHEERLLEQLIADPRQRLATLLKSPTRSTVSQPVETVPSFDNNHTDYMEGLDLDPMQWKSPLIPQEVNREPPISAQLPDQSDANLGEELSHDGQDVDFWTMEEPQEELDLEEPGYSFFERISEDSQEGDIVSAKQDLTPQHERQLFQDEGQDSGAGRLDTFASHIPDKRQLSPGQVLPERNGVVDLDSNCDSARASSSVGDDQAEDYYMERSIVLPDEDAFARYDGSDEPGALTGDQQRTTWSNLTQDLEHHEDSDSRSSVAYDLPEIGNSSPHQELSVDDSLISHESESLSALVAATSQIEPPSDAGGQSPYLHAPPKLESVFGHHSAVQSLSPSNTSIMASPMGKPGYVSYHDERNLGVDEYLGDIKILEGAVQHIQQMQSGLWRSSAHSLSTIKDTLSLQSRNLTFLANEREVLSNSVAALKDEIQRNSVEHDARLQRYEEEVQLLQRQLQVAVSEQQRLEKEVDEAKAMEYEIKESHARLESELEVTKQDVLKTRKSNQSVMEDHRGLELEATKLKGRADEFEREKEATVRKCVKLEHSVANLKQENEALVEEARRKDAEAQQLNERLRLLEKDRQDSEKRVREFQTSLRVNLLELEKLRFAVKSLTSSLGEAENDISALEEEKRKGEAQIKLMQAEMQEKTLSSEEVLSEKRSIANRMMNLEHKLSLANDEVHDRETTISKLEAKCIRLEDEVAQRGSETKYLKEQNDELNLVLQNLRDEVRSLTISKASGETRIHQLEDRLENGVSAISDNERLREKYMQCERERKDLESKLTTLKAEYHELTQQRTRELVGYQNHLEEYEQETESIAQLRLRDIEAKDAEISLLKEEVGSFRSKFEASKAQLFSLQRQLQASDEQINEMNGKLSKYHTDLRTAEEQRRLARAKKEDAEKTSEAQVELLNRRIHELETNLAKLALEQEKSSKRSQRELSASRLLSLELDNTRDDLSVAKRKLLQLQRELEESETERQAQERRVLAMKSSLSRLEYNAKQFELLVSEQKDFASVIDSLQRQNNELNKNILQVQRERDACVSSLELGRQKLSQLAQKNGEDFHFLESLSPGDIRTWAHHPYIDGRPELFLTDHPVDRLVSMRAEEIALCLAISAKATLQNRQDENSDLRSRMYSLMEEKEAENAALQRRIKFLEGRSITF